MFMSKRYIISQDSCCNPFMHTRIIRRNISRSSKAEEIKEAMRRSIQGVMTNEVNLFDPKHHKVPDEIYGDEKNSYYKEKILFSSEEDVPTDLNAAIRDLDHQYELVKKQAAIALQDPDVILYESLINYRIKELETKWLVSNEPMSKKNLDELDRKREEIIMEVNEQFEFYFSILPELNKRERREYRQSFLDEMGGMLHFYEDEKWKSQFMLKQYDLSESSMTLDEQFKLFLDDKMLLENRPDKLYKQYDQLMHYVPMISGNNNNLVSTEACPDRILAHLEKRNSEVKIEQLRKSYEESEKQLAQIDDELLEKDTDDTELI